MRAPARRILMLLAACVPAAPAMAAEPTGGTAAPAPSALTATPNVLVGGVARFRGAFSPRDYGRAVTVERFDAGTASWTAIAGTTVERDGSYHARWRADVTGRHRTRARLAYEGGAGVTAAAPDTGGASAAAPTETSMTVYREALASWYGPGLYGRTTACGQRLTRSLLGVAHKRLPCGAEVALTYHGRSITVPVVDRGPFRPGRRWDLTAATAKALGFTFTDRIGAVRID